MKTCSKCGVPKDESAFYTRPDTGNLRSRCEDCENLRKELWALAHPKEVAESREKWNMANPYYHQNKYQENPEPAKTRARRRRVEHPEKIREEKRNARKQASGDKNLRYKHDPEFRLKCVLRSRLRNAVIFRKTSKSASTMELTGCSWVWLEVHLESLFKPGMMWENQGLVWHIDHIKPCAAFDLTNPDQQNACFHWTNLQPLFVKENLSKGAKYNG